MKRISKIAFAISLLAIITIIGCSKSDQQDVKPEQQVVQQSLVTDQINKVETQYNGGTMPAVTYLKQGDTKVETTAPESYKQLIYENSLKKIQLKSTTQWNGLAAVLEYGACTYAADEFYILLDCENSNNSTNIQGDAGATYKSNGDVFFKFCVVPLYDANGNALFKRHIAYDYAILKIGTSEPAGSIDLERYFDTEDDNDHNQLFFPVGSVNYTNTSAFAPTMIYNNADIYFHYFPKDPVNGMTQFPVSVQYHIPTDYLVFGDLNKNGYGYIWSDDEDNGNANWMRFNGQPISSSNPAPPYMIQGGSNTTLYFTRITNGAPNFYAN